MKPQNADVEFVYSAGDDGHSFSEQAKARHVARCVLADIAKNDNNPPDTRIAAAVALAGVGP